MGCITSTTMQVLWNGQPGRRFQPSRGMTIKGDPLLVENQRVESVQGRYKYGLY